MSTRLWRLIPLVLVTMLVVGWIASQFRTTIEDATAAAEATTEAAEAVTTAVDALEGVEIDADAVDTVRARGMRLGGAVGASIRAVRDSLARDTTR